MGFSLSGAMIPRKVRRLFDQRCEPRFEPEHDRAVLVWRGRTEQVRLCNVSTGGAMIAFGEIPRIGEPVTLQMLDQEQVAGQVRWVRDGHVGINFTRPLD